MFGADERPGDCTWRFAASSWRPSRFSTSPRAQAIDEASYGPDHPDVAIDLNNLAQLLQATNRLGEAEPSICRALAIDEASYGPDHPDVATASTTWPNVAGHEPAG